MPEIKPNKVPDRASPDAADRCSTPEVELDAEHKASDRQKEIGGRDGPDPTRYGDWEKSGRCIDF